MQCLSYCLAYFSLMPSSCIHVVASGRIDLNQILLIGHMHHFFFFVCSSAGACRLFPGLGLL